MTSLSGQYARIYETDATSHSFANNGLDSTFPDRAGGIPLSDADKKALVSFLKTLTDEKYREVISN